MRDYLTKMRELAHQRHIPWCIKRRLSREYFIMLSTKLTFKLVSYTEPIRSFNESAYEVCTLLDRSNVYAYLLAIKSFYANSPVKCRVTIVSDGSLHQREKTLLSRHIKGVNIHDPFDIETVDNDMLSAIKAARERYHTVRKTWDIYHAMKSKIIIFLDSDLMFLRRLDDWIFDIGEERQMIYNKDHDHSTHDPLFHLTKEFIRRANLSIKQEITDLNCGFMVFSAEAFNMELIGRYIQFLYERKAFHTVMEQDCWNIVASTIPSVAMPDTYVVGDYGEAFIKRLKRKDLKAIHFVGGIRYRSFKYMKYALQFIKRYRSGALNEGEI